MSRAEDITLMMRSFSSITGVGICFYDLEEFFMYTCPGSRDFTGHRCELCTAVRVFDKERCEASDRKQAVELAAAQKVPFYHRCHLGLYELVVPLYNGERLCGLVFLGQCRISGMDAADDIASNAEKLGVKGEVFRNMYLSLPLVKNETLLSMGNIIKLYCEGLIDLENMPGNDSRSVTSSIPLYKRVSIYIQQSYRTEITPHRLCEIFFVNQSYLARHFKKNMGVTLSDYINQVRTDNAKRMLSSSDFPVHLVALNVGYTDANYFTKLFRAYVGMTPTEYRSKERGTTETK